ncbi:DUF5665 domain-containing protein [Patescibacteria group bacterium]
MKDITKQNPDKTFFKKLRQNFFLGAAYGLGQALGLTIIFAIVVGFLVRILSILGGLPYIGTIVANIVQETNEALSKFN